MKVSWSRGRGSKILSLWKMQLVWMARLDFMWRKKGGDDGGIRATIRLLSCYAMLYIVANYFG